MEKIAEVFYSTILPIIITALVSYFVWRLQRNAPPPPTVDEFQKLFNEVQEERDNLKKEIALIGKYKVECDDKIEKYRLQVSSVMDNEMTKRRELETKLDKEIAEKIKLRIDNDSLRVLVNNLTDKLSIAQEQITSLKNELKSVRDELIELKKEHSENTETEDEDKTTPDV